MDLFYNFGLDNLKGLLIGGSTSILRYDLPNGFTYLQKRFYKPFFFLNICHFKTIHRTPFLSFWIFDFINKIENIHFIHI